MTTSTQNKTQLCKRCGKPLINNHGEPPYCMTHGEQSPEPVSEPIKNKKTAPAPAVPPTPEKEVCPSCQKPLIIDGNDKICLSCHTFNGKKSVIDVKAAGSSDKDQVADPQLPDQNTITPDPAAATSSQSLKERRQHYQKHKAEMIRDLIALGAGETLKKWGIKRQMISHLKSDPLYHSFLQTRKKKKVVPPPIAPSSKVRPIPDREAAGGLVTGRLPGLPTFNSGWPTEMQLKWLQVYEKLIDKN